MNETLDRSGIIEALTRVGARLDAEGLSGDLFLVWGAAMALAYDARRFTRDVDAIFEPKMRIYEVALEVAEELSLPSDWLNDAVKGFVVEDPKSGPVLDFPGLRVQAASAELMLALKVQAARLGEDDDDLRTLAGILRLTTAQAVLDLAASILGDRKLTPRAQFFVEAVLAPE